MVECVRIMALILSNSIFVHVPKTGGYWVRHVVRSLGLNAYEYGHEHCNFRTGLSKLDGRTKNIFMFVRHPAAWYQSLWAFRMKHGWSMVHPLDFNCASNHFPTFVSRALDWWPDGWVSRTYEEFASTPGDTTLLVGRQEHLQQDLIDILLRYGEITHHPAINTPVANDSSMDGISSDQLAIYPPELLRRVMLVEHRVISRWYQPGWELRSFWSQ